MRGAVRMASGDVGSADVVSVMPTLEFGVAFTLNFDAGFTREGDTSSICSGVHLFRRGVWRSERTLVSERKIFYVALFFNLLTGAICSNISRRSVAAMTVWSSMEVYGMRE